MITLSIAVNKIDKSKFFTKKNGDKMLDLILIETPNSKYDTDYMVVQGLSKADRDRGQKGPSLATPRSWSAGAGTVAVAVNRSKQKGVATMDGKNDKTQPQELLEEVIGITHGDTPEFPTLAEQQEYYRKKDMEEGRAEVDPDGFKCLTCQRVFKSAQAVRMHVARVHTQTILAVGEKAKQKPVAALPQNPTGFREVTDKTRKFPLPQFPTEGRPVETLGTGRKWSLARRRRFNAKKRTGPPCGR